MTQRDESTPQEQQAETQSKRGAGDDRRSQVNPADNPHPNSPEADADAVREGEEKLDRVKPY